MVRGQGSAPGLSNIIAPTALVCPSLRIVRVSIRHSRLALPGRPFLCSQGVIISADSRLPRPLLHDTALQEHDLLKERQV